MSDVLYKKYGSNDLSNMGRDLQAGQDAMTRNFKGVLADVDGLLKTVEKGYVEDNTLKLQDYLRTNIKSAGLGADAPEMDQITSQFGKLIDKDVLGKTIADTRAKMVVDATDQAGTAAGTDFSENEDLGSATGAFKQSLLSLGMKDSDATAEATKWRQNNTYLAEDVELNNAALVNDFGGEVLNAIKSHQGKATAEEVINSLAEDVPEKLRNKAIMSARDMVEQRSKLTTEQQEEHDYIKGTVNRKLAEFDSQQAVKASSAAAAVAKYDSINPAIMASANKLAAENPAGVMKSIAEDAGSWFGGLFGRLDGQEVTRELQPQVTSLIKDYGVPAADAYAIGLQAYQEARADGGEAWIGSGSAIQSEKLQERVHEHLSQWSAKQAAIQAQSAVLLAGVTERARLMKAGEELTHGILKGERFSNIDGKPYDSQAVFKKSLFGGGGTTTPPVQAADTKLRTTAPKTSPTTSTTVNKVTALAAQIKADREKADKAKANLKKTPGTPTETPITGKPVGATSAKGQNATKEVNTNGGLLGKSIRKALSLINGPKAAEAAGSLGKEKVDLDTLTAISGMADKVLKSTKEGQKFTFTYKGKSITGRKLNNKLVYDHMK